MATTAIPKPGASVNLVGLTKTDYKGAPSTLCNGCGHDSIASQIIAVGYDLSLAPHRIAKFSRQRSLQHEQASDSRCMVGNVLGGVGICSRSRGRGRRSEERVRRPAAEAQIAQRPVAVRGSLGLE